jgi:SAM-dependent methyltransferase
MTTNYDHGRAAELYRKAKEQPWRSRIESYSFMKRIGDLAGRDVLDVACGEGHYTRKLRQAGAARVVGVDLSERMIELAKAQEGAAPLGVEYRVEDARAIAGAQEFDLVVAAWLLVYARDRTELASMCRGLSSRLRPGGRLVTLIINPDLAAYRPFPDYSKYGFEVELADPVSEGSPVRLTFLLDDDRLDIENYYLPVDAYTSALRDAGFRDVAVHLPELSPSPEPGDDAPFWAELIEHPIAIVIDGVKV